MYNWNKPYKIVFFISLLLSSHLNAEIRCSLEFNGTDGIQQEEIPLCSTTDSGDNICPLQLQECNIPLVTEQQQDGWNSGTCSSSPSGYQCDLNSTIYPDLSYCQSVCREPNMIIVEVPGQPVCPAGNQFTCSDMAGTPMCSPNQCFDTETVNVITDNDSTEGMSNDALQPDGSCTGEFIFFPGTRTSCKLAGYSTRWDNCCNNGNKVITDSFSSPKDRALSAYETTVGFVEQIVGGSYVPPETVDKILTASGQFIDVDFAVDIANWLVTPCADESPQVAMIASGYCTRVGSYCSERWELVGCVQRKEVHCCFNSLLAQIMHEQGRPQLPNMGWGTATAPNCDGFTKEQFQAIDFSKIDFSSYESEIVRTTDAELGVLNSNAANRALNQYGNP